MQNQNENWFPPATDEELEVKRPEGLSEEQSKKWDEVDNYRKLIVEESLFSERFQVKLDQK